VPSDQSTGPLSGIVVISQSHAAIHVHLVFSTKDRRPLLTKEIRGRLHQQLGSISKNLGCQPMITGGVEDHVHLLGGLGRSISVADWVKELKRVSNLWLKDQGSEFKSFQLTLG
jgi:REP element-mobilizing transposase RayT